MMYIGKSWGNPAFFFAIRWGIHIKAESKLSRKGAKNKYRLDSKKISLEEITYESSKILWTDM